MPKPCVFGRRSKPEWVAPTKLFTEIVTGRSTLVSDLSKPPRENVSRAEAKLVQALELQPLPKTGLWNGEKDGAFYKVMPVNRLATKADLNEIVSNFDSKPEFEFFKTVLRDADVKHLYFTGMLTSDKTDFAITYIDPESNTLRNYYPDFLAQKNDGS